MIGGMMPIISVGIISGSGIMLVMLVMNCSVDSAVASHDGTVFFLFVIVSWGGLSDG